MAGVAYFRARRQRAFSSRHHSHRFPYFSLFREAVIVVRGLCGSGFQLRVPSIRFVALNGKQLRFNKNVDKVRLRNEPFVICFLSRHVRLRFLVTRYFSSASTLLRKANVVISVVLFNGLCRFSGREKSCRSADQVCPSGYIPLRFQSTITCASRSRARFTNSRVVYRTYRRATISNDRRLGGVLLNTSNNNREWMFIMEGAIRIFENRGRDSQVSRYTQDHRVISGFLFICTSRVVIVRLRIHLNDSKSLLRIFGHLCLVSVGIVFNGRLLVRLKVYLRMNWRFNWLFFLVTFSVFQ